jgi:phage-related protein
MESLDSKYTNLGSAAEGMWRQFEMGIAPVGEAILNLVNENLPLIQSVIDTVSTKVVEFVNLIPPAIADVRKKWDEDWGGMRTTAEQFATDMPDVLAGMWAEIDALFGREGAETKTDWESLWNGMTSFFTGVTTFIFTEFTALIKMLRLGLQNIGALLSGDWQTLWNGFTEFFNTWADFFLNIIEFTFGPALRDKFVGALHSAWDGMKDVWDDIKEWWDNTFGWLLGQNFSSSSFTPSNLGIVNPQNQGYAPTTQSALDSINYGYNSSQFHGVGFPQAQTSNATTINVNLQNGSYDQGFATGEGVLDAMRFRGAN